MYVCLYVCMYVCMYVCSYVGHKYASPIISYADGWSTGSTINCLNSNGYDFSEFVVAEC